MAGERLFRTRSGRKIIIRNYFVLIINMYIYTLCALFEIYKIYHKKKKKNTIISNMFKGVQGLQT